MADEAQKSHGLVIGLVVLIVLLVGAAGGAWYLSQPKTAANAAAKSQATANSAIPSLGSQGRALPESANYEVGTNGTDQAEGNDETEPETEHENNAREIDIWLYNLGVATKAGDRKGMAIDHDLLKQARPDTLVDARVRFALENETNAIVRIQYLFAFHEAESKFAWAQHVYDNRPAKFLGTDELYTPGEIEELKLIAGELFEALVKSWRDDEQGDARVMALLRNAFDTQKPDWLLEEIRTSVLGPMIAGHMVSFARSLEHEMRNLLLRRTLKRELREPIFAAFILTFDPHEAIFTELEQAQWWDYASVLPMLYSPRRKLGDAGLKLGDVEIEWLAALRDSDELPRLLERLLQGTMDADAKRLLIQRIAAYDVPNGRAMIEAGLAGKDANYPDYLIAFGSFANSDTDLQRLTSAADDTDVAIAQGGVEGLRQSSLKAADSELRKVLEQGANPGVKSQALGALLSRTNDKSALLEEYLDVNKDAALRAVAVASIPESSLERLQKVVEDDPSLRVRQAALNRLGAIKPGNTNDRKRLRAWFLGIKERDPSPVIRSAARKFADALND